MARITGESPEEAQDVPPLAIVQEPANIATSPWQQSYYDPTSQYPLNDFAKLGAGAVDIHTGRRTGENFPSGEWKQV